MLELKEITKVNFDEVVKLKLAVNQKDFVSTKFIHWLRLGYTKIPLSHLQYKQMIYQLDLLYQDTM